ncbi:L-rhamnose-binding lectin CSL2-like [Poecilia reticulata]|uniref:L-rhamnose-binding lectin CSL2-like n=1 Tax=Poecilia reticulata TaxID=8081 RepID=UPI0004A489BD|nr:PREDICTED: L-rhamnose-binding lectin CSL2-like [Poecilia reticulata]
MTFVLFTLFLCGFILEINAGRGFQKLKTEPRSFPPIRSIVACEESMAGLVCETGSITVTSAKYGRSDQTTCSNGIPYDQTMDTDCTTRADLVFERCNGKSMCLVLARSSLFRDPCVGTYKYLEVKYVCEEPRPSPTIRSIVACEESMAGLVCETGSITVTSAKYGRSDRTTCSDGIPDNQTDDTDCKKEIYEVGRRCNGKSACAIFASTSVFRDPCVGTYKYLEVKYFCQ